jgi:hypothetical protein
MTQRIKPDVLQALQDWKAGKPVKSLELGHVHRMQDRGQHSPVIDFSVRLSNDQERAHAYCFHLMDIFLINGVPDSHEAFISACNDYELTFDWGELPASQKGTFDSERDAAESLAWKALHVGWARAIAGHAPEMYIDVVRETRESKRDLAGINAT